MGIGFILSMIVMIIAIIIILVVIFPFERKYVVRENRKINYKKTTIYLRWNVFDTLSLLIAIYTIICVQVLNILISTGQTIENPFVQFFTNQSQAWVIVTVAYLITRISATIKCIKANFGEIPHEK